MNACFRIGILIILAGISTPTQARNICTLVVESVSAKIVYERGAEECDKQVSPASTFKIALAAMGFDHGYLLSPTEPEIEYQEQSHARFSSWRHATNPQYWLANSVIWFSQELTKALGEETVGQYMVSFNFGNLDMSGHPGKNDGLMYAWLGTSLMISPRQQVSFLRNLDLGQLPISEQANKLVWEIVPHFDAGERILSGKTGSVILSEGVQLGWFVGRTTWNNKTYVFSHLIEKSNSTRPLGLIARDEFLSEFEVVFRSIEN